MQPDYMTRDLDRGERAVRQGQRASGVWKFKVGPSPAAFVLLKAPKVSQQEWWKVRTEVDVPPAAF